MRVIVAKNELRFPKSRLVESRPNTLRAYDRCKMRSSRMNPQLETARIPGTKSDPDNSHRAFRGSIR